MKENLLALVQGTVGEMGTGGVTRNFSSFTPVRREVRGAGSVFTRTDTKLYSHDGSGVERQTP